MKWLALHIDTVPQGLEPLETMLSSLGIDGLVIEDETDFRRFLEQNKQYWENAGSPSMWRIRRPVSVKWPPYGSLWPN